MTARMRWARFAVCAALVGLACAGARPPLPMPPLESWGDLDQPYGDSLDAAAWVALGEQPLKYQFGQKPIRLEDYWFADAFVRNSRERRAASLRERAQTLKSVGGLDSLGLYLEAIRVAPTDVLSYEQATRILLDRGEVMRAHALAAHAIRLDRKNGVLWFLLGQAYVQRGSMQRARRAFEHSLKTGGGRRTNVAEALAILYVQHAQSARAESLLTAESRADSWLAAFSRAKQARTGGDLDAARRALIEATQAAETQLAAVPAALFTELASVQQEAGDLDAAEVSYRRALAIAPYDRAARNGLGVLQWTRGNLRAAVSHFRTLLQSDAYNFVALFNLGGATLQLAQQTTPASHADSLVALSERCFTTCIDYGHEIEGALLGRSHARLLQGNFAAARSDAEQLLGSKSHASRARLILARAALSEGDARQTVDVLMPAFEDGTLHTDGLRLLGNAYLQLGDAARAATVLRRAHERAPDDVELTMHLGVALSRSGEIAAAETLLRELAQAHPNDPAVLQNLAAVLDRLGKYRESNEVLRRLEKLRDD